MGSGLCLREVSARCSVCVLIGVCFCEVCPLWSVCLCEVCALSRVSVVSGVCVWFLHCAECVR